MTEATEVRAELDRMREQGYDGYVSEYSDTVELLMNEVVKQGTFTPRCSVSAEINLTWKERITGTRQQDMTAMLLTGLMLGSALERDIPKGSDTEQEWRNGEVELP